MHEKWEMHKKIPKNLIKSTKSDGDGYPEYRRRSPQDGGHEAKVKRGGKEFIVDNSWVVPYNPLLSIVCNGHVNVEVAGSVKCVKYILKYVNKGSDQAIMALEKKTPKIHIFLWM